MIFNVTAFFLFLIPQTRGELPDANIGWRLIFIGVYIERGWGSSSRAVPIRWGDLTE